MTEFSRRVVCKKIVRCGRHGIAQRYSQSHNNFNCGRSATGVHGSVMGVKNRSVTEGKEKRVGLDL